MTVERTPGDGAGAQDSLSASPRPAEERPSSTTPTPPSAVFSLTITIPRLGRTAPGGSVRPASRAARRRAVAVLPVAFGVASALFLTADSSHGGAARAASFGIVPVSPAVSTPVDPATGGLTPTPGVPTPLPSGLASYPVPTPTPTSVMPGGVAAATVAAPAVPAAAPVAPLPAAATVGTASTTQELTAAGIPARAKTAYTAAATRLATLAPSCGLSWSLLAAIGRVESDHGRVGGSTLSTAGRATPPIYGARLDGTTAGTSLVRDTDGGVLDADATFDRAIGPLQFLPSTWKAWATDGDGDKVADPQDIDDAAVTAGRYLCSGASAVQPLSSAVGQWNAAYRYNHSASYANLVLALSTTYATGKVTTVSAPPAGAATPAVTTPATKATTSTTAAPTPTTTTPTSSTSSTSSTFSTTSTPTTSTGGVVTVTVTTTVAPSSTTSTTSSTAGAAVTVTVTTTQTP